MPGDWQKYPGFAVLVINDYRIQISTSNTFPINVPSQFITGIGSHFDFTSLEDTVKFYNKYFKFKNFT